MRLLTAVFLLGATLSDLAATVPIQDSPRQRLLDGKPLPAKYRKNPPPPYTPGHRDPYDSAVDAVGKKLDPLPWRNGDGASVLGPWNRDRARQNPDLVRPPSTDHGDMPNLRWSFVDSHMRIEEGGWTRQTTVREMPASIELAGVNMRLDQGVIRELHWHKEAEWAYVLDGNVRVTALDYEGGAFMDDLSKGDLWYFPPGVPHSLQGLRPNGTEFLLIFDDGSFSEESTFLLTDWLAHTPKSVLSKNFDLPPEIFAHIPPSERYIFQGTTQPGPIDREFPHGKHVKKSNQAFTHHMLAQPPQGNSTGGQVRITDSRNFPISKTIAAAHVTIAPGALREMHWHPNADEWSFFVRGRARVTVFGAEGAARTFDYQPGDVGVVPRNMGHFVENIGEDNEEVEMLEIFRADEFRDFSLFQWLGESPRRMVADTLFQGDKEAGERFLKAVEDAGKEEVRLSPP
ncbi:RmlC-like cupin domain-containing protein [Chaetomidium leptoderma]|uniref:RmlC-like cupin domain-containing protein n=1 Tax=Chaetomidium leptoderma TaxID=669021 RepID=A0AAN6ZV09_9PEZI|nr:RmlC-like cupin domain-containing protein [Chaetomidium leptoderma]